MAGLLDNVQVLGLLVQASGAALIGAFSWATYRSSRHRAAAWWTLAWLLLAVALVSLLLALAWPPFAVIGDSTYLLAEYGYLYFLALGVRSLARPGRPEGRWLWLLLIVAAIVAVALPWWANHRFAPMFAVQSALLALGFAIALALIPTRGDWGAASAGLRTVRASLVVLIAIFVHYVPIFWLVSVGSIELPFGYLKLTSVAHLVAEFALGYGGALAVVEIGNRRLLERNRALRQDSEHLRQLSETDPLTGALNRRALVHALRSRVDGPGAVALLDVDDMKQVNAQGGHALGDAVLRTLGSVARSLVRDGDLVVRWGGDEFVVVATGLRAEELAARLDLLQARLRVQPELALTPAKWLGVSFGVAEFNSLGGVEAAISEADSAMFRQKQVRKSHSAQTDLLRSE